MSNKAWISDARMRILSALMPCTSVWFKPVKLGGVLEAMNRLSKLLEDVARPQNQIKAALSYPVVVGFLAIIFVGMTVFNTGFAGILKSWVELPALTQFMLWISEISEVGDLIPSSYSLLAGSPMCSKTKPVGRETIDRLSLVPLFGDLIQKISGGSFQCTFGSLTRSGCRF